MRPALSPARDTHAAGDAARRERGGVAVTHAFGGGAGEPKAAAQIHRLSSDHSDAGAL